MLVYAIFLRKSIDLFCLAYCTSTKDEKNLRENWMSTKDWNYCIDVVAFLAPFYDLVKEIKGKAESGKFYLF